MNIFRTALAALGLGFLLAGAQTVAHAAEPQNLKVLSKTHSTKEIEKGMKAMTKGLGVKCEACHVKGKMPSDDVKNKEFARTFFTKTVGNGDQAGRKAALADLIKALELKQPKNEASIWEAVDGFKKQ